MSRLTLPVPRGFRLHKTVCSYGYFLLAPNRWQPVERVLIRPLLLESGGAVRVRVSQPAVSKPLRIDTRCKLSRAEAASIKAAVGRMLRLHEDLTGWRKVRTEEARRRGFGRMFRSPSLFEDMVKTITGCNVAWRNTISMNRLLCEHYGEPTRDGSLGGENPEPHSDNAFPTPTRLAGATPQELNRLTRVGYRAERIIRLARDFAEGRLDPAWFEDPARSTDELHDAIASLHGFGPYATANVLMLLGRYDRLAIDTETYRHFEQVHGLPRGDDPQKNHDRIERHYRRFAPYEFIAYWFELWREYEKRFSDARNWGREEHAPNFTAFTMQRGGTDQARQARGKGAGAKNRA
ncbi:MAG: DNA-3-methyladenine glycosylase family protein [Phycisphaeraceae bacterium]